LSGRIGNDTLGYRKNGNRKMSNRKMGNVPSLRESGDKAMIDVPWQHCPNPV